MGLSVKAFESIAWHLCIYEKRSSILLIFHIDNVVQQAKLQGRRNWVGGQRGAIVPQILINKSTLSQPWVGGGHIMPTTLLPRSWIFRPSYGPVAKQMWNCMRHVHCYSAHVTASHSF